MTFSPEQLNFFKFSAIVLDEFPIALRQVFIFMWDNLVTGAPKWDDSVAVRNLFLRKEGGKTRYAPTDKSIKEWDCTALFDATVFAKTFAMPDGTGKLRTLKELYTKSVPDGTFHHTVVSPSSNQAETYALALDQLRLLRNTLCHQISTRKIDKATFDGYVLLAKEAFAALGQNSTRIDEIGKLDEKDFPTETQQKLKDDLKKEKDAALKFQQIEDHLKKILSQVVDVCSDVKDVKTAVTDVRTQVKDVGSDVRIVKTELTDIKTQVEDVGADVKDVKTGVTDVKRQVEDVGSDVQDVKTGVTDMKTQVTDVGSDVKYVKTGVTDVETRVKDVGSDVKHVKTQVQDVVSDVKDVKTGVTAVKTQVEDVKTEVTVVKTQVEDVRSDVKELKENFARIQQPVQEDGSKGLPFPHSCVDDKIQHFVGRQEECQEILEHLIDGLTRIVAVYGPPGYGKTTVVTEVAHQLRQMEIPVYLISLRGMRRKDELVSTLLSIFAVTKQVPHPQISVPDFLIGCLRQLQNRFVLMLDDADDFLESGDAKLREEFMRFVEQILERCNRIKVVVACRERLDYLGLKHRVHPVRVCELDRVASGDLVKLLLPDVSEADRNFIVLVCGQVPLLMCLMCSFVTDLHVSVIELLSASELSPLLNRALDNDSFCDSARPKVIVSTCIERLAVNDRNALVSLGVFLKSFGIDEAKVVLNLKTELESREKLGSLKRKSLIECSDNFETCKIHSVFRSIIEEKVVTDQEIGAVFNTAQRRYHLYKFGVANERNLTGRSNEALATFVDNREDIISSLVNGAKDDELFSTVVNVLAKAELLLFSGLRDELLFNSVYDRVIEEAKRRHSVVATKTLMAAKSFGCYWGWFSADHGTCDPFLQGFTDAADCPAKLLCYYGVHQILCGELEEGMSLLTSSVDRLSSSCDEKVLKELFYLVLSTCHRKIQEKEMASHFEKLSSCDTTPATLTSKSEDVSLQHDTIRIVDDANLLVTGFYLISIVYGILDGEETAPVTDGAFQCIEEMSSLGRWHNDRGQLDAFSIFKESIRVLLVEASNFFEKHQANIHLARLDHLLSSQCGPVERYNITKRMLLSQFVLVNNLTHGGQRSVLDKTDTEFSLFEPFSSVLLKTMFVNSLKSFDNCPGIDFEDLAGSHDTLGFTLLLMNDHSGAQESFQEGLRLRKVNNGDPSATLTKIGQVHFRLNNEVEAEKTFQSALSLRKSSGVYDHVDTANIYATLGTCHLSRGNLTKALEAHQNALQLRKKHLGEHTLTALSFHEVGIVFRKMKDYESAKEAFHGARRMSRKLPGQEKNTAIYCHHVALVYYELRSRRDLVLARAYCQQALAPRLKLGDQTMARRLHLLGRIHYAKGDLPSALEALQKASRLRKETLGDHPNTASTFHVAGYAYYRSGDNTSAVNAFQEASRIRSNLLGDHEDTGRTYHWLGKVQYDVGDINGAIESLQKAAQIRKEVLPVDHPDTAKSARLLNVVYEALSANELD